MVKSLLNSQPKALLIGDFRKEYNVTIFERLYTILSGYEVFISGSSLDKISNYDMTIIQTNSEEYILKLICADIVFILNDNTNFTKFKSTQKVVRFTKAEFPKRYFNSDDYNKLVYEYAQIDKMISLNSESKNNDEYCFGVENIYCDDIESFDFDTLFEDLRASSAAKPLHNYIFLIDDVNVLKLSNTILQLESFLNSVGGIKDKNIICIARTYSEVLTRYTIKSSFTTILHSKQSNLYEPVIKKIDGIFICDNNKAVNWLKAVRGQADTKQLMLDDIPYISEYLNGSGMITKVNSTESYLQHLSNIYSEQAEHQKISVIIPHYNTDIDLLCRAIDSVLNNAHENVEVIVVDDGSEVSYEKDIKDYYATIFGKQISYYYKANEGPGLTRNYGLTKATGEYIFFLDADDTITELGLMYMISHACFYKVDVVIAKRVLVDEFGKVINISLPVLYGETFEQKSNSSIDYKVYWDQMPNNKLMKKSVFDKYDLTFEKGIYEDALFTAKIYKQLPRYDFINYPIHNWYRYGDNTSLSSGIDINNFVERVEALDKAWQWISEDIREQRLVFHLMHDLKRYYSVFPSYTNDEKNLYVNKLHNFISSKKEYLLLCKYNFFTRKVLDYILEKDFKRFESLCKTLAKTSNREHDNYIVRTFHHVFMAMALAHESQKPSRLYIGKGYCHFSDAFINFLKGTSIFASIVTYDESKNIGALHHDLINKVDEPHRLLPHHLYNYFLQVFEEANIDDTVFIFNDLIPSWYFIERYFTNIIKVEDAFNSFAQEHKLVLEKKFQKGLWGEVLEMVGTGYPESVMLSKKVKAYYLNANKPKNNLFSNFLNFLSGKPKLEITNEDFSTFQYMSKVKNVNTIELLKSLRQSTNKNIESFYSEKLKLKDLTYSKFNLLLTQPLSSYNYCTNDQQLDLYKRIVSYYRQKGEMVVIKPHPVDKMDYTALNCEVIDANVPSEVFFLLDVKFNKVISFGSTSLAFIKCKKSVHLSKDLKVSKESVTARIKELLDDENLEEMLSKVG